MLMWECAKCGNQFPDGSECAVCLIREFREKEADPLGGEQPQWWNRFTMTIDLMTAHREGIIMWDEYQAMIQFSKEAVPFHVPSNKNT